MDTKQRIYFEIEADDVDGSVVVNFFSHDEEEPVGGMHIEHDGEDIVVNVTRVDEAATGSVKVTVH